jgi:hypothetical protein
MREAYLKNLTFSYSPFLVHIVVTIVVTPFAVHRLGEFDYGILVLFNTLLGYLALANVGTPQAIVRKLIRFDNRGEPDKIRDLIGTIFLSYTVLIFFGGILVWAFISQNFLGIADQLIREKPALIVIQDATLPLFLVFAFDLWRLLFDSIIIAKKMRTV